MITRSCRHTRSVRAGEVANNLEKYVAMLDFADHCWLLHSKCHYNVTNGWMRIHLRRYLSGKGHVEHAWTQAFLVEEEVMEKKNNPLLRSQLLLNTLTGSNMLPASDHWRLSVRPIFNIALLSSTDLILLVQHYPQHRPWRASSDHGVYFSIIVNRLLML